MTHNSIPYGPALKKQSFENIHFEPFSTAHIRPVFYDDQLRPEPDTLGFRDMLLEVFSAEAGIKVLKINLFMTPHQAEFDGLGFLYLEDKTILPIRLEQSAHFKEWAGHITEQTSFGETKKQDWLLSYEADEYGMHGMSHTWEGKHYTIRDYDVYKETGKFLFDNSPKKFNLKQITAEKTNYLKKYINTSGQAPDAAATLQSFHGFIDRYQGKINPALKNSTQLLEAFKASADYALPAELKTIYASCNGASFPGKTQYFLGLDEVLSAWKGWKLIYDDWLLEELQAHESDGQKSLPMYTTPYWIPFISDGNGNYMAIDYAPGKKGQSGQIIVFGADEDKITVIAENLNALLENYVPE